MLISDMHLQLLYVSSGVILMTNISFTLLLNLKAIFRIGLTNSVLPFSYGSSVTTL